MDISQTWNILVDTREPIYQWVLIYKDNFYVILWHKYTTRDEISNGLTLECKHVS